MLSGIYGETSKVVFFGKVPEDVSQLRVEFGTYWTTTNRSRAFVFSLPARAADLPLGTPVALKQAVLAGQAEYRAYLTHKPSVSEFARPSEFMIRLEAANNRAKAKDTPMFGPLATVIVSDDVGSAWVLRAGAGGWLGSERSRETGEESVVQEFNFMGKLSPEARELRLQVAGTGEVLRGPWVFEVTVRR